jgi:hypothetical protein
VFLVLLGQVTTDAEHDNVAVFKVRERPKANLRVCS